MPDLDLATALNMFQQGAKDLALSRSISSANDAVQQIKASEMNEQQQRAANQQVANQLVTHMAMLGAPATTMQAVAGAIGPKQYANADAMNMDAVLTGNKTLGDEAVQQREFANNKAFELLKLKLAAKANMDPIRAAQAQNLEDERFTKHLEGLDKAVDTQTARFGNISKLQGVNNRIKDARTLLDSEINPSKLGELAASLDNIVSAGASTVAGRAEMKPNTLKEMLARSKEFLTSEPSTMDIDKFKAFYHDSFDRIEKVNQQIISDAKAEKIAALGPALARKNPSLFRAYVQERLGRDAEIDPKTGRIKYKPLAPEDGGGALPDASATAPAAPQFIPVTRMNRTTGQMETLLQGPDGKLYKQ